MNTKTANESMPYTLSQINLSNSEDESWRLVSKTEDEAVIGNHGLLFCLAELKSKSDEKIAVLETLNSYVHDSFEEQNITITRSEDLLEHLLEEVNRKFTELTAEIEQGAFNDLSFIIGIIKEDSLVISSYGTLQAWLLHPFAKKGSETSYRWVNILENAKSSGVTTSGKLFDQVIAGELSEKQTFIIATKNIWQVFTQDKFKDLLLSNRSRRVIQVLTKTINNMPSPTDMALLLGKFETKKRKVVTITESDTINEKDEKMSIEDQEKHSALTKLFGRGDKTKREREREQKKMEPVANSSTTVIAKRTGGWFGRLSRKAKITFVFAIILIGVFVQSIAWINNQNQDEKISIQFDERMQEIQDIRDEAEAKLIYNDKESARELINRALELTYNLPERYTKEGIEKKALEEALQETLLEIDGLETLPDVQSVFSFSVENTPSVVHGIIPLRSGIMVTVTDKPTLTLIDIVNQTTKDVTLETIDDTITDAAYDSENQKLYVLTAQNSFYSISLTNLTLEDTSLSVSSINLSLADIGDPSVLTFYADRLYVTDTVDQQIKKITLANETVDSWLTTSRSGLGAVLDIAIDSNIYLLTQDSITQFFRGASTDWQITGLTPEPTTLVDMDAKLNNQYIYLLDNATRRLILVNPNGVLYKQFTSSLFKSPAMFSVNEATKELYILDGNTIYRIPITWLSE